MTDAFTNALSNFVSTLKGFESASFQWMSLAPGIPEFDENVIFFGFEAHRADPSLVAKTPRLPQNQAALQVEHDRLVELWRLLGDEAEQRLQKVIALTMIQGQPVLITTFLQGKSLLRVFRKSFWPSGENLFALFAEAGQTLRKVVDCTITPLEAGEVIPSDFSNLAAKYKQMYAPTSREIQELDDLAEEMSRLALPGMHKILIQGDFWHGNMLRNSQHGQLMLLDWQYARWSKDVSLDLYMFPLAGALAAVPKRFVNGPAEARAQAAIHILYAWNKRMIPEYLNAFGQPKLYAKLPLRSGLLACCVENAVRASLNRDSDKPQDLIWKFMFSSLLDWPK
ncbi:MAG: aminoglycoside phosphotransferase family protein [Anaerolineales bacterium]|nr:aminoglycoside phosphotransferase family protein [Anaerolineales bacterium]